MDFRKSLFAQLKDQRGFGLVETIIAAVILGLVSLSIVYLVTGADGQSSVKRKDFNESCRNVANGALDIIKEKGNSLSQLSMDKLQTDGTKLECSGACLGESSEFSSDTGYAARRANNRKSSVNQYYGTATSATTPWNINVERLNIGYMNYINTVVNSNPGVCTTPSSVLPSATPSSDILNNLISYEAYEYFRNASSYGTPFSGQFGATNSSSNDFQIRIFVEAYDLANPNSTRTINCSNVAVYPQKPSAAPVSGFNNVNTQKLIAAYPSAANDKYDNIGFKVTAKVRYRTAENVLTECSESQKFQYDMKAISPSRNFALAGMTSMTRTVNGQYTGADNSSRFAATVSTEQNDSVLMCRDRSRKRIDMTTTSLTLPQTGMQYNNRPIPPSMASGNNTTYTYSFPSYSPSYTYFLECPNCTTLPPFNQFGTATSLTVRDHTSLNWNKAGAPVYPTSFPSNDAIDPSTTLTGSRYESDGYQNAQWIPCSEFVRRANETPAVSTRLSRCKADTTAPVVALNQGPVTGQFTFQFSNLKEACDVVIDVAELTSDYRVVPDDAPSAFPLVTIAQSTEDLDRGPICWNSTAYFASINGYTISPYSYFFAGYSGSTRLTCGPAVTTRP